MRTKHLLTAMVLPLAFAACSQEEIVSNENLSMANRKTVENVVLNFEGEAASRMIYNGAYEWEIGDQYGACLMDVINGNYNDHTKNWYSWFTLTDYIHTNYPFTKQSNGFWTSEAVMSEGNYFFYYPYNSNMGGKRTAIKLAMPQATLEEGDRAASVLNDQLFVGYSPIVADPEKESDVVNVTMQPILATAGFTITSDMALPFTIRKVALVKKGGFPKYFIVDPTESQANDADFNGASFASANDANKRAQILGIVKESEERLDKIAVNYVGGRALYEGDKITTYMMLPIDKEMKDVELHIYTNRGLGIIDLDEAHLDDDDCNYKNDIALTSVEYGTVKTVKIELDDQSLKQLNVMNISTTDELEDLVSWNAGITGPTTLTARLMENANVTISKYIAETLNGNKNLTLNFAYATGVEAATLNIPADAPAYTWDEVDAIPANVTVINNGSIKLTKDLKKTQEVKNLYNNGSIEFAATVISASATDVYNYGTMNFTKADMSLSTKLFENHSAINVKTALTVTRNGLLNNGGTINIENGKKLIGKIVNKNRHNCKTEGEEAWSNFVSEGIVNVEGTWNAAGTNSATINVEGTLNVNSGSTFTNNAKVLIADNIMKYQAKINNSGAIKGITNNGLVVIETTSASYEAASASKGKVNNNIQNSYIVNNQYETIFVALENEVKSSELKDIVLKSNAESIEIKGTLNIDPEDAGTHTIIGNNVTLDIEVVGDLDIKGEGTLIIAGNTTGYMNKKSNTSLNIYKDVTVDIYPKANLKVGFVDNAGVLKVQSGATLTGKPQSGEGNTVIAGTWTKDQASK